MNIDDGYKSKSIFGEGRAKEVARRLQEIGERTYSGSMAKRVYNSVFEKKNLDRTSYKETMRHHGSASPEGKHLEYVNKENTKTGWLKYSEVVDRTLRVGNELPPGKKGKISNGIKNTINSLTPFALDTDEFLSKEFTTRQALGRTLGYANPFNESVRADMTNVMGMLTKNQKLEEKAGTGAMRYLNRTLTSGFATYMAYEAYKNDENVLGATIDGALGFGAMSYGMTLGRGVGGAAGTALSRSVPKIRSAMSSKLYSSGGKFASTLRIGGALTGMVAGAITGAMLYGATGIGSLLREGTKSDNEMVIKAGEIMHSGQYGTGMESQDTYTMRQKALAKMSQSGLNDRAMALGNEAMIMRNIM